MSQISALGEQEVTRKRHQNVTAFVWIDRAVRAWNISLLALLKNHSIDHIYVGFAANQDPSSLVVRNEKIDIMHDVSLPEISARVLEAAHGPVLFCSWPGKLSAESLDLAVEWMNDDPRVGTVSFLSNAAGAFSFPHRNTGSPFGVDGHDETSLTHLLRSFRTQDDGPTPVQMPDGAMVLVNRNMWEVCGPLDSFGSENLSLALCNLALLGSKRGFNSYLDTYSYITTPWDDVGAFQSVLTNADARHVLHQRFPYFPAGYDIECARPNSVLAEALDSARARAVGLRVLIDGSALGPKEMGTQVLTLKLSLALAERPEIQALIVGVPDPSNIPSYAQDLVGHRKIRLISAGNLDFPDAPHVDIIHRPYQPSSSIPWDRWRALAKRSLITVQDLIAYRNAAYFENGSEWVSYRDNFLTHMSQVDGVISISHDVVKMIKEERLPIDFKRIHVVENGTNARTKQEATQIPDAVLDRGWASSPYLLVLGATYAHKNRDLAIRVWSELRRMGYPHKLILAGAAVPFGSLRVEEGLLIDPELAPHFLELPDVGSEERNWLLFNSNLVVYLTSAEGFGLVPFEAACVDVPTLFVSFGPLRELTDDPNLPKNYAINGLVDRARLLLDDPDASKNAISGVLKNAYQLKWSETARKSVDSYYATLAQSSRTFGA